ncbi:MAG TPA: C40 family peptidase [Spirochaetia bacterium]|nr:C40 family peptidase [Spirochaetia bacterium]
MAAHKLRRFNVVLLSFALVFGISGSLSAQTLSAEKVSRLRTDLVQDARNYLGVPYVYGGNGPNSFDCSGLVCRVYQEITGTELPRTTQEEFAAGVSVDPPNIRPGDLVFFNTEGYVSHVGIYIGHDQFIHAASAGPDTGVITSSFAEAYYRERFVGARRYLPALPAVVADSGAHATTVSAPSGSSAQSIPRVSNLASVFSGNFVMTFGKMTLKVSDAEGDVQGVFTSSGYSGWMIGKIDRNRGLLRLDWVIPETATHYRTSGEIVFTPSDNGGRLVGSWHYDGETSWHNTWIAVPSAN